MTPEAIEARRAYRREYYKKHKAKHREWAQRYWQRKAEKAHDTVVSCN